MGRMEFQAKKTDRLDRLLREQVFSGSEWLSRQAWDWLIENGYVSLDGRKCLKSGAQVAEGASIGLSLPDPELGLLPAAHPAELVWEGSGLAAFSKTCGTDSVPLFPWDRNAFANQVSARLSQSGRCTPVFFAALADPPKLEGGLLQRLDRDTSGLMLVALDTGTKASFRDLISRSQLEKTYEAVVVGELEGLEGDREFWLKPSSGAKVQAYREEPKAGGELCHFQVRILSREGKAAHIEVVTRQGARHIVRAGMASLGAPLAGDALYGGGERVPFHQLHASRLKLLEKKAFPSFPENLSAPLPETFLDSLRLYGLN